MSIEIASERRISLSRRCFFGEKTRRFWRSICLSVSKMMVRLIKVDGDFWNDYCKIYRFFLKFFFFFFGGGGGRGGLIDRNHVKFVSLSDLRIFLRILQNSSHGGLTNK